MVCMIIPKCEKHKTADCMRLRLIGSGESKEDPITSEWFCDEEWELVKDKISTQILNKHKYKEI